MKATTRVERMFTAMMGRLRDYIRRMAWRLADSDADLADDLAQQAMIGLWRMGPERLRTKGDRYFVAAARLSMKRALLAELDQRCGRPVPPRLGKLQEVRR